MDVNESLFENEFNMTKELAKEYTRVLLRRNIIMSYIFGFLCVLSFIWMRNAVIAVIGVGLPILLHLMMIRIGRQTWKRWIKFFGMMGEKDNLNSKKRFFENSFISINPINDEHAFEYKQISHLVETTEYLYISLEKVFECIVKKDSFTKGDYETFVTFLRERLAENPKALRGLRDKK
jgi:hypothetical protein